MEITYTVDGDDERLEMSELSYLGSKDGRWIAQGAAEQYFSDGGDENSWPLLFEIFVDDVSLGKFSVEMEYAPTFSAIEAKGCKECGMICADTYCSGACSSAWLRRNHEEFMAMQKQGRG